MTAPTTAAPSTMVSAYERTKPFCTLRSWPDQPVITEPVPFTAPSTPPSSKSQQPVGQLLTGTHEAPPR